MGVTDQGAREARYAEAIFGTSSLRSLDHAERVAALMALADAEVAAAVSEAQAEMRAKWAADVANVQAVALAQRNDAVAYRAEVERLREGIRALHTKGYASTSEEVWGQNPQCDECGVTWPCDTIALLAPSPAATTGEDDEPLPDYLKELQRPTPVSSGEAEQLQGSAKFRQDLALDTCVIDSNRQDWCRTHDARWSPVRYKCDRPAPVVTPSAEGGES